MSPSVKEGLGRFTAALRERFGGRVSEVVLFGSQARGDAHEDSDVDVLVVIDDLSDHERCDVIDLAYDVNAASDDWLGLSTSHVRDLRRRGRRLWADIEREGIGL